MSVVGIRWKIHRELKWIAIAIYNPEFFCFLISINLFCLFLRWERGRGQKTYASHEDKVEVNAAFLFVLIQVKALYKLHGISNAISERIFCSLTSFSHPHMLMIMWKISSHILFDTLQMKLYDVDCNQSTKRESSWFCRLLDVEEEDHNGDIKKEISSNLKKDFWILLLLF